MSGASAAGALGGIVVETTSHRGFSPDEWAERALTRLMYVSDTADPMVKAQAMVFKDKIRAVLVHYMKEAIRSDRTTLIAQLDLQGHGDMANIVRNLK